MTQEVIRLDKFKPRDYQLDFIRAVENRGYKRAILSWPRRCLYLLSDVLLSNGSTKKMKDIKVGDKILSWNGYKIEEDIVKNVWKAGKKELLTIYSKIGPIHVTPDHRFFTKNGYKDAINIKEAFTTNGFSLERISYIEKDYFGIAMTYDLETEKNHNFFANGYLVHNSGKDICAWNIVIRAAIREVGSYIYCLPSFSMCRRVLLNSKLHDGSSFMDFIPKKILSSFNRQEMKITLTNGSIIIMVGSDNADQRVVGMAAKGIVISEAALASPVGVSYLLPMVAASNGFFIAVSCVNPDTLVITDKGLKRIKNISSSRDEYTPLNKGIYGLEGFHNATDFYYGGKVPTLKIELMNGFEIECSYIHKLWNGSKWVKSVDLKVGDLLPVQYDQQVFGKGLDFSTFKFLKKRNSSWKKIPLNIHSEDFFYLLGLIHGDGSFSKRKVTITNKKDKQIQDFLLKLGFNTYGKDEIHFTYSSTEFMSLLEFLEFKHGARNKVFPEKLFDCTKNQLRAFLQGLFDSDGSSHKKGLKFDTSCKSFAKTLQIVLLNFGIASSLRKNIVKPTKRVKVTSIIWTLDITGYFAYLFYRDIGFRLKRKQENKKYLRKSNYIGSGNIYPVKSYRLDTGFSKKGKRLLPLKTTGVIRRRTLEKLVDKYNDAYLKSLIKEKFYFSRIKTITKSVSEVFDFVIPETHSFFSNGFISHNTPRGHNNFYNMYQKALSSEYWYVSKLTVDDTKHVSHEEIQKIIDSGLMSYELAQQEFWTSFSSTNQGAYYGSYLDKMRVNDQITEVPYEPSLQTYVFMDIGMNDMFTMLFVQTTSLTIRIFDYYENHSEGLEHYTAVIKGKGYGYVKVYAPHDIRVRELTTGISRLEKMRSLGLDVDVVANLPINEGIEAVRTILPKTYIDKNKCEKLVIAIENYTKEWDEKAHVFKNNPKHDRYCFTGDTLITMYSKERGNFKLPIEDVRKGDYVETPFGPREVKEVHSRKTKKLVDVRVSEGFFKDCKYITTTKSHNFFTQKGKVRSVTLRKGVLLEKMTSLRKRLWLSILKKKSSKGIGDTIGHHHKRERSLIELYLAMTNQRDRLIEYSSRVVNFFSRLLRKGTVDSVTEFEVESFIKVYDLTVDKEHCYYAEDYLVSNSHANDALRYLAVTSKKLSGGLSAEELDDRYNSVMRGRGKLPRFFE